MKPIEILIHLFEVGGFWGLVAGLIVLGICVLIYEVAKHFIILYLHKWFPNIRRNPLKTSFFNKMKILIFYKVPRLTIWCPLRDRIFKSVLVTCFRTWEERVKDKVIESDIDKLDSKEYLDFWKNFVYKTTDSWEEKAIANRVPVVAIEKYRKVHKKTIAMIIEVVEMICTSEKIYRTNTEKTIAILDFVAILLDMALLDAETTIMLINGELSKENFEGITCSGCTKDCTHKVEQPSTDKEE